MVGSTTRAYVGFHPHFAGSNTAGVQLTEWGNKSKPYYKKSHDD
ncbi:hypothetical protein [Mucilaginibacter sp. CSA2-8R]